MMEQQAEQREAASDPVENKPVKQYEIDIFLGWCKSCGICVSFCPRSCLGQGEDGSPVIMHSDQCNGCGWCEIHCPDFAISVHPQQVSRLRKIDKEEAE